MEMRTKERSERIEDKGKREEEAEEEMREREKIGERNRRD
jgi:hypothetical protein